VCKCRRLGITDRYAAKTTSSAFLIDFFDASREASGKLSLVFKLCAYIDDGIFCEKYFWIGLRYAHGTSYQVGHSVPKAYSAVYQI
jgi:hypothetical protein